MLDHFIGNVLMLSQVCSGPTVGGGEGDCQHTRPQKPHHQVVPNDAGFLWHEACGCADRFVVLLLPAAVLSVRLGEVARADHYRARYRHLNRSFHNYLRITRILKCLGEVRESIILWILR